MITAEDAIDVAHSAANRWTGTFTLSTIELRLTCIHFQYYKADDRLIDTSDNIFTLQQWCSTTFPQAKEQLEHMYREVCSVLIFHMFPDLSSD